MKSCWHNLTKFGTGAFQSYKQSKPNFVYEKIENCIKTRSFNLRKRVITN